MTALAHQKLFKQITVDTAGLGDAPFPVWALLREAPSHEHASTAATDLHTVFVPARLPNVAVNMPPLRSTPRYT